MRPLAQNLKKEGGKVEFRYQHRSIFPAQGFTNHSQGFQINIICCVPKIYLLLYIINYLTWGKVTYLISSLPSYYLILQKISTNMFVKFSAFPSK